MRLGIALVADCCHALGARDEAGVRAGAIADVSVLSFHPVKHIAEVAKFAVSLEREGGVPEVEGPVILASK